MGRTTRTGAPNQPTSQPDPVRTDQENATAHLDCDRAACLPRAAYDPTVDHGIQTAVARPARLDYGHPGIRLIPTQAKASTPGHPTGRDDSPAGGVLRKLAGRSPGVAIRHPSGTLLCLHVPKPGSDGLELTPLLPLGATRSSPCRRLGYIVTRGPAMTTSNQWITKNHGRRQPVLAVPSTAYATGAQARRPDCTAVRQVLGNHGQPRASRLK